MLKIDERRDLLRRKLLIFLFAAAVLAAGLRLAKRPVLHPRDELPQEAGLVEYFPQPLSPLAGHPLAQMQDILDHISNCVLRGEWNTASQAVRQLEQFWQKWRTEQGGKLGIEKDIDRAVQALQHNALLKEEQKTLNATKELTELINQLPAVQK